MSKITEKQVEQAKGILGKLEPKEKPLTRAEAIAALASEIRDARDRGLSFAEIVEGLAKAGIETSEATVKRAIRTPREKAQRPNVDQAKWQAGVAEQTGTDDADTVSANASNSAMTSLMDRAAGVDQG